MQLLEEAFFIWAQFLRDKVSERFQITICKQVCLVMGERRRERETEKKKKIGSENKGELSYDRSTLPKHAKEKNQRKKEKKFIQPTPVQLTSH